MSRLCRLKTASHGYDGKWAYGEITKLRQAIESQAAEIEKYKALCDQMGNAIENAESTGTPFSNQTMKALEAWGALK